MAAAIGSDFIAVAASDVDYANFADQSNWEVRWLRDALADARHGLFQGMYAVTPSGHLLGQVDGGWPLYDPAHTRTELARTRAAYGKLSREWRLLDRLPDPERDRAFPLAPDVPEPGLERLSATKRTRPFDGMRPEDVRHPQHVHFDRVDVRAPWLASLVPTEAAVGAVATADPRLLEALVLASIMQPECSVWREDELRTNELTATVVGSRDGVIELRLDGRLDVRAVNQWNDGARYEGRLGGRAVWNTAQARFESLDLALFGAHTLSVAAAQGRPGARTCDVAVHLRLERPEPAPAGSGPKVVEPAPDEAEAAR
ncbi:hypothetical protein [Planctomycetes bacterium Pla163]|uniref:hypothetical protein n=1 Tax=Rohdeia mirabilis TaxID=2528008 RepID=UPI0011A976C1